MDYSESHLSGVNPAIAAPAVGLGLCLPSVPGCCAGPRYMIAIETKGFINLSPPVFPDNALLLTIYFTCSNFKDYLSLKI